MSWGILKFKLPEENEEFVLAQRGALYSFVIDDVYSKLRSLEKYEDKESLTIDEFRNILSEKLQEYDLK